MSNVDRYIQPAFEAIQKVRLDNNRRIGEQITFINSAGKIPKVYKGYISSLGANIIQAGIRTAIYFYEAKEGNSEGDRRLITAAIRFMLYNDEPGTEVFSNYFLSEKLSTDPHELQKQALQILDAATALKLALRTYSME